MRGRRHGFCIEHAVEASDVLAVWGDAGVAQMRGLAERILGPVNSPWADDAAEDG